MITTALVPAATSILAAGGHDTQDKLFLLSTGEAWQYFASDAARRCTDTDPASDDDDPECMCSWWLRSPQTSREAALVRSDGSIDRTYNATVYYGVRPALWLPLPETAVDPFLRQAKPGSTITLGSYEQDNNKHNGCEPIQWLVLARENNRLLAISKYALARRRFHEDRADVTWETCSLRRWLNDDFFRSAFSAHEQTLISSAATPDMADRVFLLSLEEALEFLSVEAWACMPTAAIEGGWQGVQVPKSGTNAAQPKPAQKERQYRCL